MSMILKMLEVKIDEFKSFFSSLEIDYLNINTI